MKRKAAAGKDRLKIGRGKLAREGKYPTLIRIT